MSLLTVAAAIGEEIGLGTISAVATSSDKKVKRLLRLLNRAGKRLAKKNWTILQKEHTFATVNGTAAYSLPSDYARMLDFTAWNRDSYWSMRGQLSPWEWQIQKSAIIATTGLRQNFRIKPDTRVNKFYIDPTPTTDDTLVYEYASTQWVKKSDNSSGLAAYAADGDIALLDEELLELEGIWRYLRATGFDYEEEREEARAAIDFAFAEDQGGKVLNFGGARDSVPLQRMNIPEGGFG